MLSFYTVPSLQFVIMYQLPTAPDVHGHLALAVCVGKHHPSLARSHSRRNGFATWYLDLTAKAESPLIRSVVSSLWDCYSGITTRSITSTLVNPKVVTPIKAVKQIDFILSIKCRSLLVRYALLTALAFVLLLSSQDLQKVSPQPLYASVHATMFLSLLRKVSHIVSLKSGHYFRLTQSQNI